MKVAKIIGKVIICMFAAIGAVFTSAEIFAICRWGLKPFLKAATGVTEDLDDGYYDF